jgi:glc operon protein GlcG
VTHEQALEAIRATLETTPAPVSIAVVDDHGELVACLTIDGAARDTLENARRKAYTAARSDATSTRALADKVQGTPTALASFDPQFSFFHGGVAAFSDGRRVGAVGVSGLPGAEDERLAVAAIRAAGLEPGN